MRIDSKDFERFDEITISREQMIFVDAIAPGTIRVWYLREEGEE
jgi:hypothetical protein